MQNPPVVFRSLASEVGRLLQDLGYHGRGFCFRQEKEEAIAVIDFQKSRDSNKQDIEFTVNIGVWLNRVARAEGQEVAAPEIEDCHYRERLGFVAPEGRDRWWRITPGTDATGLANEIFGLLQAYALPLLETYSSEAGLKSLWLSGRSPGLTKVQRDRYLSELEASAS